MTAPGSKVLRKWAIRAGGSLAFLAVLFWLLPWDTIVAAISRVPLSTFLWIALAFMASHVAAAAKWWMVIGRPVPFLFALRAHFGGLAANLCLPGAIGGDAMRAALVHGAAGNAPNLAAGALFDRLVDVVALILLSLGGLLVLRGEGVEGQVSVFAAVGLIAAAVLGFVVMPQMIRGLWRFVPRLPGGDFARRTAASMQALTVRPVFLAALISASTAIQGGLVYLSWLLAAAAGLEIPLEVWAFAWPLAKILAILPISLNGLGVREASLAALLVPFGAISATVVAGGLAWQGVLFLTGAIGGLVLVLGRPATKTAET